MAQQPGALLTASPPWSSASRSVKSCNGTPIDALPSYQMGTFSSDAKRVFAPPRRFVSFQSSSYPLHGSMNNAQSHSLAHARTSPARTKKNGQQRSNKPSSAVAGVERGEMPPTPSSSSSGSSTSSSSSSTGASSPAPKNPVNDGGVATVSSINHVSEAPHGDAHLTRLLAGDAFYASFVQALSSQVELQQREDDAQQQEHHQNSSSSVASCAAKSANGARRLATSQALAVTQALVITQANEIERLIKELAACEAARRADNIARDLELQGLKQDLDVSRALADKLAIEVEQQRKNQVARAAGGGKMKKLCAAECGMGLGLEGIE